jgi:hypothetical protein
MMSKKKAEDEDLGESVTNDDGTITTTYKDGFIERTYPDGRPVEDDKPLRDKDDPPGSTKPGVDQKPDKGRGEAEQLPADQGRDRGPTAGQLPAKDHGRDPVTEPQPLKDRGTVGGPKPDQSLPGQPTYPPPFPPSPEYIGPNQPTTDPAPKDAGTTGEMYPDPVTGDPARGGNMAPQHSASGGVNSNLSPLEPPAPPPPEA